MFRNVVHVNNQVPPSLWLSPFLWLLLSPFLWLLALPCLWAPPAHTNGRAMGRIVNLKHSDTDHRATPKNERHPKRFSRIEYLTRKWTNAIPQWNYGHTFNKPTAKLTYLLYMKKGCGSIFSQPPTGNWTQETSASLRVAARSVSWLLPTLKMTSHDKPIALALALALAKWLLSTESPMKSANLVRTKQCSKDGSIKVDIRVTCLTWRLTTLSRNLTREDTWD